MYVRRAADGDIAAVVAMAQCVPESSRWDLDVFRGYVLPLSGDGSAGDRESTASQQKALFVACVAAQPIGFAAFAGVPVAGEYELETIAVEPAWRRGGAGLRLLQAGLLWCRSWGPAGVPTGSSAPRQTTALWLEVRAANAGAIALYERAGFTQAGERPGYYQDPPDDAVRMQKPIEPAC